MTLEAEADLNIRGHMITHMCSHSSLSLTHTHSHALAHTLSQLQLTVCYCWPRKLLLCVVITEDLRICCAMLMWLLCSFPHHHRLPTVCGSHTHCRCLEDCYRSTGEIFPQNKELTYSTCKANHFFCSCFSFVSLISTFKENDWITFKSYTLYKNTISLWERLLLRNTNLQPLVEVLPCSIWANITHSLSPLVAKPTEIHCVHIELNKAVGGAI